MRGRELLMALTGLNSRGYKNSTLLFNLARIFIAHSPARDLINPPWKGIAEPMWEPMQIRHRSAYYDAFFTEALLSFVETGLASSGETAASRARDLRHGRVLPDHQPRGSARAGRLDRQRRHRAGAAAASALLALLRPDQAGSGLRHLRAGLRHHRLLVLGGDPGRLRRSDPRPAAAGLLRRLPGARRRQRAARSPCRSTTTSITRAASSPGSTISPASGPSATTSIRRSISTSSKSRFRNLSALEDAGDAVAAGDRASHHRASRSGWPKAAPSPIRARTSIICRSSIAPISAAATPPSSRCRSRRRRAIDPDGAFDFIRARVLAYVQTELIAHEMNAFDAALALIALGHLGADVATFTPGPALHHRAASAKAAGTGRSRPMSGTR